MEDNESEFDERSAPLFNRRAAVRIKHDLRAMLDTPLSLEAKQIDNFSSGGFFINTRKEMKHGSQVKFRVVLPEKYRSKDISVVGKVMFCMDPAGARMSGTNPGVGVKVLEFPVEGDRQLFAEFLCEQVVKNKGSKKSA